MTEEKSLIDLAKTHISGPQENAEEGDVPKRPRPASNQVKESNEIKDALNKLLAKANEKKGWVSIDLPSKGYLNPGCDGTIKIRPFTFEDEKILRSVINLREGTAAIKELVERCTDGIVYREMALVDKAYILFKLREISYGNLYPINAPCTSCGDVNELTIELDKLPVEYATEEIEDPKPVKLPDSEVTAYVKYPRAHHESLLENLRDLTDNLWRFVDSIEEYSDRGIVQQFIGKTTAKDVALLRSSIFNTELGLQTEVRFRCSTCSSDEVIDLPMNENFFSVN